MSPSLWHNLHSRLQFCNPNSLSVLRARGIVKNGVIKTCTYRLASYTHILKALHATAQQQDTQEHTRISITTLVQIVQIALNSFFVERGSFDRKALTSEES